MIEGYRIMARLEEFDAYFMEDISHIFSVKVVGKSPQMDERLWEKLPGGSE